MKNYWECRRESSLFFTLTRIKKEIISQEAECKRGRKHPIV